MKMANSDFQMGIGNRKKKWRLVDLEDLQSPKNGYICFMDRYWLVTEGKVLFYGTSPQCNTDQAVVDHILAQGLAAQDFPNLECVFVPVAYLPPNRD